MKKRRVEFYEENETTAGRRTYDVHDCSNKCWELQYLHPHQKWWKQMSPQKQKAAKRQLKK